MAPFNVPDLASFAAGDTDYIAKLNSDNAKIEAALAAINGDLTVGFESNAFAYALDHYRRHATSDPSNGVIGGYSLRWQWDSTNEKVDLLANPIDSKSQAVIAGQRCEVTGTISTTSLSSLTASPTVYVGVNYSETNSMTAAWSQTVTDIDLPLYKGVYVAANNAWASVERMPRTVLWDNTVEQLRQETTETFTLPIAGSGGGTGDTQYLAIPYDHVLKTVFAGGTTLATGATSGSATVEVAPWTPGSPTGTAGGAIVTLTLPSSSNTGQYHEADATILQARPAGQVYRITYDHNGSHTDAYFGLRVLRAFNSPTV